MPDTNVLDILVPLQNPEAEESLVRLSAALATTRGSVLHLTHIETQAVTLSNTPELLDRACQLAAKMGVAAVPHLVHSTTVTEGIQRTLREQNCDMMVMGWYHDVEENAILSARNRALTKAVDVDTLIFKDRQFRPPSRIIAPTGGGNNALVGIQIAHELAQTWNAKVEVLRIARDRHCEPDDSVLNHYCSQIYDDTCLQLSLLNLDNIPVHIVPAREIADPIIDRTTLDDLVILGAANDWQQSGHLAGSIPDEIANRALGSVLMVRSPVPNTIHLENVFWDHTIRLDFAPKDKWEAIAQLVDALIEEKQVPASQRQVVLDTAFDRERNQPTAMGHETAIPHAPIPGLPNIIGCLGICPNGVDFGGNDNYPVRFVFLLLTPRQNYRNYIPVLAEIATLMHSDDTRMRFASCKTPHEVTSLLRKR